jgi:hypothetical protein
MSELKFQYFKCKIIYYNIVYFVGVVLGKYRGSYNNEGELTR